MRARKWMGDAVTEITTSLTSPNWARLAGNPYLIAVVAVVILIVIGSIFFPENSGMGVFLFDYSSTSFFAADLSLHHPERALCHDRDRLGRHLDAVSSPRSASVPISTQNLLPEDDVEILQIEDLGPIRRKVAALKADENSFLPQLVELSILQLFTSKSLDQTVKIFTSTLELMSHRLDLQYQTMRFLVWIIPTTGFIGTVVGISIALEGMRDPKNIEFAKVTSGLAVAFYTTILALLLSAILVFLQNIVQRREEQTLNRAAQYCLKNLINRIYTGE